LVEQKQLIQGRLIGSEELTLIRARLAAHPSWNRSRLSRELCLLWDWHDHTGRLKDMACRSLLLKLQARGHIELPPRCHPSVNSARNRTVAEVPHDPSPIRCPLEDLKPLQVQPLVHNSADLALFHFLLQRYHYLGHRTCVGENLKYLARDRSGRPLACLLFGSPFLQIKSRDRFIGWNADQRRRHLYLLTNNTRFIILPYVEVAHLASHLLGQVIARVSADWLDKYAHPVHLVETYVERGRFPATCYRAAGWVHVGLTTGRSRNLPHPTPSRPIKEIYLKALVADFRGRLAP
jgi:hypothetical protein